jgi:hypothetical protein
MAAKRQFLSDVQLTETLSKLQKKNEEEIELISELSSQCDQLVKDIKGVPPDEVVFDPTIYDDQTKQLDDLITIEESNQSVLVISSTWWHSGLFIPMSHKLKWQGNKWKSISIYYKPDESTSAGSQFTHSEFFEFDYGDNQNIEAEIKIGCRTRSNDITTGFQPSETGNGGAGYWTSTFDHNLDTKFYYPYQIRTDRQNPWAIW